jgi:hypothetical protein
MKGCLRIFGILLTVLGVVGIGVGIAAPIIGFGNTFDGDFSEENLQSAFERLVPTSANLCREGEALVDGSGEPLVFDESNETTIDALFCENAQGTRRDVTEAYFTLLLTQAGGIFGGLAIAGVGLTAGGCSLVIGLILLVISFFVGGNPPAKPKNDDPFA